MAVSGGQDSLCLAQLLYDLQPKWHWHLGLVHCDHRWREDSANNAVHVLNLAAGWQVPAWKEVATTPPKNEADARHWRYGVFAKLAREQGCSHVVTGHTASDRAETVLYNLSRGTGIDGLGPLPWQRDLDEIVRPSHKVALPATHEPTVQLVRPLLYMSRQETAAFCQQQQLAVWEDSSNQDLRFRRNRIRHELLPYLRSHFNPKVEQALAQLAEITAAESTYLKAQSEQLYEQTVIYQSEAQTRLTQPAWKIKQNSLKLAPLALQRRVVRQVLQRAFAHTCGKAGTHPPTFVQVEKVIALLGKPNGTQSDPYPGGWIAKVEKPFIVLRALERKASPSSP